MFSRMSLMESVVVVLSLLLGGGLLPPRSPAADERTQKQQQELVKKSAALDRRVAALYQRGAYREATVLMREALAMRPALYPKEKYPHGHADLASSLNNLGGLLWAQGEYARAEPFLRDALAMQRVLYPKEKYPHGYPDLANSLNNLGALLQVQGEFAKAEPFYREALAMLHALYPRKTHPQGHPDLANTLNNLGALFDAQGQSARAEPFHRAALAIHRAQFPREKFANGHPGLVAGLINLGFSLQARGEYAGAEPFFREARMMNRGLYPRETFPRGHPILATSLNNLGFVLQEQGEYARAEPLYRDALAMRRALYPTEKYPHGHPQLAATLNNLGSLLAVQGAYARAEATTREALPMYRAHLRRLTELGAEAQALNFAVTLPRTHDAYLAITRRLPATAGGYDELWQRKALLSRILERRHLDLLASKDPQAHKLGRELTAARQRLAHLLLAPARDFREHTRRLNQLTEEKEDLEKRLVRQLRLAAPPPKVPPAAQALADVLPAKTAFVDVIRYTDFEQDQARPGKQGERMLRRYVAFVLTPGQKMARRVELGPAALIEQTWHAWRQAIIGNRPDADAGARFARLTWEPLRKHLPAKLSIVYLSADHALTQVPWAALPGKKAGTVLLEEHAVGVVPHGPWLLEQLKGKTRPRGAEDRLLVAGGIAYNRDPASIAKTPGEAVALRAPPPGGRVVWKELPGTAHEQQQVVALARKVFRKGPLSRSGASASTAQLQEDLPRVRYAHLATHGFFADAQFRSAFQVDERQHRFVTADRRTAGARSPLVLSGLVLAGANCTGKEAAADRGILTAEALVGLNLNGLELAVLSACDTGVGDFRVAGGEGVYGLQRAFHLAGCKNVIASLWKVDDDATAALMGVFYRHLWVDKLPPLEALRQAQLYLYRNPSAVPVLAKRRGDLFAEVDLPRETVKPSKAAKHASTNQWAAFVLSGVGR